jgi:hypothetical protein
MKIGEVSWAKKAVAIMATPAVVLTGCEVESYSAMPSATVQAYEGFEQHTNPCATDLLPASAEHKQPADHWEGSDRTCQQMLHSLKMALVYDKSEAADIPLYERTLEDGYRLITLGGRLDVVPVELDGAVRDAAQMAPCAPEDFKQSFTMREATQNKVVNNADIIMGVYGLQSCMNMIRHNTALGHTYTEGGGRVIDMYYDPSKTAQDAKIAERLNSIFHELGHLVLKRQHVYTIDSINEWSHDTDRFSYVRVTGSDAAPAAYENHNSIMSKKVIIDSTGRLPVDRNELFLPFELADIDELTGSHDGREIMSTLVNPGDACSIAPSDNNAYVTLKHDVALRYPNQDAKDSSHIDTDRYPLIGIMVSNKEHGDREVLVALLDGSSSNLPGKINTIIGSIPIGSSGKWKVQLAGQELPIVITVASDGSVQVEHV